MHSLTGFLPEPAFVMGKKNTKNLTAAASEITEAAAFSVSPATVQPEIVFIASDLNDESDELLTRMIKAMAAKPGTVEVENILGVNAFKPRVMILLGEVAMHSVLGASANFSQIRGQFKDHQGMKVMVTFHPSHLISHPADKKVCWDDLQLVMKELGWKK